jgi:hypothetical protein
MDNFGSIGLIIGGILGVFFLFYCAVNAVQRWQNKQPLGLIGWIGAFSLLVLFPLAIMAAIVGVFVLAAQAQAQAEEKKHERTKDILRTNNTHNINIKR